eukprot:Amastigsp_a510754_33.p4 type:complete len:142 gc:universal Amastigsp_a510754_33:849-1274(+)
MLAALGERALDEELAEMQVEQSVNVREEQISSEILASDLVVELGCVKERQQIIARERRGEVSRALHRQNVGGPLLDASALYEPRVEVVEHVVRHGEKRLDDRVFVALVLVEQRADLARADLDGAVGLVELANKRAVVLHLR